MKTNAHNIILVLLATLFLGACYSPRYLYSPMSAHVPALKKANDFSATAYYSAAIPGDREKTFSTSNREKTGGADIHAAFAFNKHWGVHSSVFYRRELNHGSQVFLSNDSTVVHYMRHMIEWGALYYTPVQGSNHYYFSCIFGIGMGRNRFTDKGRLLNNANYYRFHNARINKYFLQPALMFEKKQFRTALVSRFSFIHVLNYKTNYTITEQDVLFPDVITTSPYFFWEPSLLLDYRLKKFPLLSVQLQGGMSYLISKRFLDYRSPVVSIGINLAFNTNKPLKFK